MSPHGEKELAGSPSPNSNEILELTHPQSHTPTHKSTTKTQGF